MVRREHRRDKSVGADLVCYLKDRVLYDCNNGAHPKSVLLSYSSSVPRLGFNRTLVT